MTSEGGFISVDDHVVEPADLWTRRLSRAKWNDRIPHIEQRADGTDHWVIEGRKIALPDLFDVGAAVPVGAGAPECLEAVPDMACNADLRLKAMDTDGVDYSVLYPTVSGVAGQTLGHITDADLELACVQAYNDWLIEEWAVTSPRFIPQCLVPLWPAESTVREIHRAVAKGHKGVVFPAIPLHLRSGVPHINDPAYDPVWETCQDLGIPVCFHAGPSPELQLSPYEGFSPRIAEAFRAISRPASSSTIVANMLMSGAIIKHPKLKVVFSETSLGWIIFCLEAGDHQFDRVSLRKLGYEHLPSELFRRQCYVTGWYDHASLHHACRHLGANNILWSTNFPFVTSPWPGSRALIRRSFEGLAEDDVHRILWGNAATLYGVS